VEVVKRKFQTDACGPPPDGIPHSTSPHKIDKLKLLIIHSSK
jgi:hypothetical protein